MRMPQSQSSPFVSIPQYKHSCSHQLFSSHCEPRELPRGGSVWCLPSGKICGTVLSPKNHPSPLIPFTLIVLLYPLAVIVAF